MINKLVLENLKYRWVRTLLSALVVGVQVMSILTLIGLSRGMLQESASHAKGTGADIFLKPGTQGTFSFSTGQLNQKFVDFNADDRRGDQPAVTYREMREGHDIRWTVFLDHRVRISIGCQSARGAEALALLKAWNTGHPGGVTTIHANSARAALTRLSSLVQEAGVPPQPELIAETINLLVCIVRSAAGRRVTVLLVSLDTTRATDSRVTM